MNELLNYGATVLSALVAIGTVSGYLIDVGGHRQKAKEAIRLAHDADTKATAAGVALGLFREAAAREFASMTTLRESEQRLASAVEGIRTDFRAVAERFDKVLMEMTRSTKN